MDVVIRTKSSPVLAKTVATTPVEAVKSSTREESRSRLLPFRFNVGAGFPLISVGVGSSSKVPASFAWRALARAIVRLRWSLSDPSMSSTSNLVFSVTAASVRSSTRLAVEAALAAT